MLSKSNVTGRCFWHGKEITEAEYSHIKSIIDNRPKATDGYVYRLTVDLVWELQELPPEELIDEEATAEE